MNQPNDNAAQSYDPAQSQFSTPPYPQQPVAQQMPNSQPQYAYPQQQYDYGQPPVQFKSRLVAGLLGIFLGGLGIHRFYLGYTAIGVVQIVVTIVTFGLGSLWGFIEGIMILARAQSFQVDAEGRPLQD